MSDNNGNNSGDAKGMKITVDSDPITRKGVQADFASITTKESATRLDFFLSDIQVDENNTRAVLSSRVFMNNTDIVNLYKALGDHIQGNFPEELR